MCYLANVMTNTLQLKHHYCVLSYLPGVKISLKVPLITFIVQRL